MLVSYRRQSSKPLSDPSGMPAVGRLVHPRSPPAERPRRGNCDGSPGRPLSRLRPRRSGPEPESQYRVAPLGRYPHPVEIPLAPAPRSAGNASRARNRCRIFSWRLVGASFKSNSATGLTRAAHRGAGCAARNWPTLPSSRSGSGKDVASGRLRRERKTPPQLSPCLVEPRLASTIGLQLPAL